MEKMNSKLNEYVYTSDYKKKKNQKKEISPYCYTMLLSCPKFPPSLLLHAFPPSSFFANICMFL